MRCLSDVELQAVAAGEADEAAASHVEGCAQCRGRVDGIRHDLRDIAAVVNTAGAMPPRLEAQVRESIAAREPVRGSTTMRGPLPAPAWRRPRVVLALATAAVIALVVFGVLPRFGAPTTLSASQVLGRSLETLSSGKGLEMLEYELVTTGLTHGSWRIRLIVDHERPTRYHVSTIGPDGTVVGAFSQDPVRQTRTQLTRVDGRNYIVNVAGIQNPVLSLPQMAEALVETVITMMQATSGQTLTVVDGPTGQQYVVETPPVTPATSAATLDLHFARATVDADDFRIHEFEASGAILKQPFSVSFTLLNHLVLGNWQASSDPFAIVPGPDDVMLEGTPSEHPVDELLTTVIRELARTRTF